MPATSRSDQPRLGRIRFTTTGRGATVELAQLDQPAGQPGQADRVGAADHHDLVGGPERRQGHRVAAGPAAESTAGSSSRQNPVSTTTWP